MPPAAFPASLERGDTRTLAEAEGLSLEEAARKLRYGFFAGETARQGRNLTPSSLRITPTTTPRLYCSIWSGARGSGGLAGIPRQRDGILRPFGNPREDLAAYAAAHALPHVEDETNADPDAAARNPGAAAGDASAAPAQFQSRGACGSGGRPPGGDGHGPFRPDGAVSAPGRGPAGSGDHSLAALAEVPAFLRPRVLLGLFDLLGAGRKDIGAAHLEALERLCASHGNDARISLPTASQPALRPPG